MKSDDKTFGFPDSDDWNLLYKASFYTLDKLYKMDSEIKDVSELLMMIVFITKRTITHLTYIPCKSKLGCVRKSIYLFVDEQSNQY